MVGVSATLLGIMFGAAALIKDNLVLAIITSVIVIIGGIALVNAFEDE